MRECMYVGCVKCFSHIQCYCYCASWGLFWLHPDSMVVYYSAYRVIAFETMLWGDVWDVFVMYGNSVFFSVWVSPRKVRWVCMMCMCSYFG